MKTSKSVLVTVITTLTLTVVMKCGRGVFGQAADYYCSRDQSSAVQIAGVKEGDIYTLYQGDSHYQNNQNCVWIIDAGPGNRVELTVESSSLQWAPPSAICPGYDHVAIKDVTSNASASTGERGGEESIVLQWCGHTQPLGAVSSGRYVRVEFMSDKNNPYQYTGVHLHFETFSSRDCAPSWTNSSLGFCYKLLNTQTDWSSAQKECNREGANLASVLTQDEHDALLQAFGSSEGTAWIGLNDIVNEGDFQWIDGSQFSFSRFGPSHAANQYSRCVVMRLMGGDWHVKDCDKNPTKPLCKSNRGSKTVIHRIPQPRADETDADSPVRVIAISICVGVVVIIILVVGICIYRRRRENRHQTPKDPPSPAGRHLCDADSQDSHPVPMHDSRQTRQPSAPPQDRNEESVMTTPESMMLAPPAYEEALSHSIVSYSNETGAMPQKS